MDDIETRMAEGGDRETIIAMVSEIHRAIVPFIAQSPDMPKAMSMAIAASGMFAGSQFATLLTMGFVKERDTKRAVDTVGRNFREGVKVGKRRAERVAHSEGWVQ